MVFEYLEGWSEPRPIPVASGSADNLVVSGDVRLCGWTLRETSGTATASGRFWNGDTTQGEIVGEFGFGAGLADNPPYTAGGLRCRRGIYLDMVSGVVEGAVFVRFPEL